MLNENARKWLTALRGGEYKQGTRLLHQGKLNLWCCLGVACDLYQKEVGDLLLDSHCDVISFDGEFVFLPRKVARWLGLRTNLGDYSNERSANSLVALNDTHHSFGEIARVIESEPEGLFDAQV